MYALKLWKNQQIWLIDDNEKRNTIDSTKQIYSRRYEIRAFK